MDGFSKYMSRGAELWRLKPGSERMRLAVPRKRPLEEGGSRAARGQESGGFSTHPDASRLIPPEGGPARARGLSRGRPLPKHARFFWKRGSAKGGAVRNHLERSRRLRGVLESWPHARGKRQEEMKPCAYPGRASVHPREGVLEYYILNLLLCVSVLRSSAGRSIRSIYEQNTIRFRTVVYTLIFTVVPHYSRLSCVPFCVSCSVYWGVLSIYYTVFDNESTMRYCSLCSSP